MLAALFFAMVRLTRLFTSTSNLSPDVVIIVAAGRLKFQLTAGDRVTYDTIEKLTIELQRQIGRENEITHRVFFHVNRDGTIAAAVGRAPSVWPEDERIGRIS